MVTPLLIEFREPTNAEGYDGTLDPQDHLNDPQDRLNAF